MKELTDMREFAGFIRRNSWLVIFTVLTAAVVYGAYLIHGGDILMDAETYIVYQEDSLATFEPAGRYGLYLAKKLFSTNTYMPEAFLCYMMIVMCIASLFFDFCIHDIMSAGHGKEADIFSWVFNGLFISCPVLVHQFYFYYQAFEVALGFFLGILGAYAVHVWAYKKGKAPWAFLGFACMLWSFGIYQVLVPFYIAVNVVFYLADYLYGEKREDYFLVCVKLTGIFLAGLCGYLFLSKLWVLVRYHKFMTLLADNYMGWGRFSFTDCLRLIKRDLWNVIFSQVPAFSRGYLFLTVLFAALAWQGGKRAGKKQLYLYLMATAVFVVSPFFMSLLLGNCQILRAHLVYPFVFAACAGFAAMLLWDRRRLLYPLAGVLLFLFCDQISISNRYEQMIHFVAKADREMAGAIYQQARKLSLDSVGAAGRAGGICLPAGGKYDGLAGRGLYGL